MDKKIKAQNMTLHFKKGRWRPQWGNNKRLKKKKELRSNSI